ncbi:MAG: CehA/McbA family metallohydrolase [Bacillota bacterium]|nr:CehA/McbA family metallohydrolase [Bacillota bacterium]
MSDRFYLGDPHVHSTLSDGRLSPAELVLVAAARGLDFLALTDHSRPVGSREEAPLHPDSEAGGERSAMCLLPGQEVSIGGRIHFLLLGCVQPLSRARFRLERLKELAGAVHTAGGAVILAHPWTALAGSPDRVHLLDRGFAEGWIDGLEVFSAALRPSQFDLWQRTFEHYLREWAPHRPATLASSDWHHRRHGRALGLCCTYVQAPAPTPAAILGGIRARRTVAVLQRATALEDGLYPHLLPFPDRYRAGIAWWGGNLCGPEELVEALLTLRGEAGDRLRSGAPAGRRNDHRGELWRAALSAYAAGNHRRALALLNQTEG